MIHDSWLPDAVTVDCISTLSCSAQRAKDGSKLRLLMVNSGGDKANISVNIMDMATNPSVSITTLSATDLSAANPPGQPSAVSPTTTQVTLRGGDALTVPGYSFTIAVFDKVQVELVV